EPLPLAAVVPLERLSVTAIVGAAGGVANMADGGPARVLLHDALVLPLVIEAERLDHSADLAEGVDQPFAMGIVRREAGRQLAAVLQVEQHARHQAGDLFGPGDSLG